MKKEANKISKKQQKAESIFSAFSTIKGELYLLIEPYIENDMGLNEDDLCVDNLAGSGYTLMLGDGGVPLDSIIYLISKLKLGEKIKLSDLTVTI